MDENNECCMGYCQKSLMYMHETLAQKPASFFHVPQFENPSMQEGFPAGNAMQEFMQEDQSQSNFHEFVLLEFYDIWQSTARLQRRKNG